MNIQNNPNRIFLLDALGALLTALLLFGILAQLEQYFGMPKKVVYLLSISAFGIFIYSFLCYRYVKLNSKSWLRFLIVLNSLYVLTSVGMLIQFSPSISYLGWIYFTLELLVIGSIISIEYKVQANL